MLRNRYVIALDQGTTSSRALLVDHEGHVVDSSQYEFTQIFPNPGWVEHDPMEILASQLLALTDIVERNDLDADKVAAIGITNQRETSVVWDRHTGEPTYNAIVWQCRRTVNRMDHIAGDEELSQKITCKTGLVPDAYFSASKIEWILDNIGDARERAEAGDLVFGTVDSWLLWNLTAGAVHATDPTNASRTLLFDIHKMAWDDVLLDLFTIPKSMLPTVMPSAGIFGAMDSGYLESLDPGHFRSVEPGHLGSLDPGFFRSVEPGHFGPSDKGRFGSGDPGSLGAVDPGHLSVVSNGESLKHESISAVLDKLHGVPIAGIAGDQQAALFGQLCVQPGQAKNTYGTGCFLLMNVGNEPVESKHSLVTTVAASAPGTPGPQYALEGSVFMGGALMQWIRDELHLLDESVESEEMANSVFDTGGVTIVPAFTGLGAPHWNGDARGIISGLTRGTTAVHIVRAALEAIAFQVRDLIVAMEADAGEPLTLLNVDGGASDNDFLMQFQADILGKAIRRPKDRETTAKGAAYLAGLAVGFWSGVEELETLQSDDDIFEPDMDSEELSERIALWNEAVARCLYKP